MHNEKVIAELQHRVNVLRDLPFSELSSLPIAKTEVAEIEGKQVSFTVFREPQSDGNLLIVVRSDVPAAFGFVSMGSADGFLALPSGEKTVAPENLLREY